MDAHALLESVVAQAHVLLQNPLALPVAVGAAVVLLSVVLLYALSSGKAKKGRSKAKKVTGGTTVVDGIRRSTRSVALLSEGAFLLRSLGGP